MCQRTGKVILPTALAAGAALADTQSRGRDTTSYVCPFCNGWHLTTHPRRRSR